MYIETYDEPRPLRRLWSLKEEVLVEVDREANQLVVLSSWGETRLDDADPIAHDLLSRMTLGPIGLQNVLTSPKLHQVAGVLELIPGCVIHSLGFADTGQLLVSAVPLKQESRFEITSVNDDQVIRLSRFACVRPCAGELWLESAVAPYRVVIDWPSVASTVCALYAPTTVKELAKKLRLTKSLIAEIAAFLIGAGIVLPADDSSVEPPTFAEDNDPGLMMWPFHELMFHARSRMGRQDNPYAAAARYRARVPMPPAVKPPPVGQRHPLPRPVLQDLVDTDPPLTQVLERGEMVVAVDSVLNVEEIGELLYRSARVRSVRQTSGGEISDRPYPNSSHLHELELYVTVEQCVGLPDGIYHYDPSGHALALVNNVSHQRGELLDDARVALGAPRRPAALIIITARVGRLARDYCGMAHATTLRNVGLLQGTLSVVATGMGLVPAVGATGNGDMASRILALEWPSEVDVGLFMVGGRAVGVDRRMSGTADDLRPRPLELAPRQRP